MHCRFTSNIMQHIPFGDIWKRKHINFSIWIEAIIANEICSLGLNLNFIGGDIKPSTIGFQRRRFHDLQMIIILIHGELLLGHVSGAALFPIAMSYVTWLSRRSPGRYVQTTVIDLS